MMLFPRMFWKNGLKIARIILWASNYLPSSLTRVTTVKLLIWNNYFTDVTLAVEDGKQFEAHKVILATNLDLLHSSPFYNSRGSWWWWWTITSDDDGEWGILSLVKSIWRSKWKGRAHPDKVERMGSRLQESSYEPQTTYHPHLPGWQQ